MSLGEVMCSFILGIYLKVELLDHGACICSASNVFKMVVSVYTSSNIVWTIQFFHVLTNSGVIYLSHLLHSGGCSSVILLFTYYDIMTHVS